MKKQEESWPSEKQIKAVIIIDDMINSLLEVQHEIKETLNKNNIPIYPSKYINKNAG